VTEIETHHLTLVEAYGVTGPATRFDGGKGKLWRTPSFSPVVRLDENAVVAFGRSDSDILNHLTVPCFASSVSQSSLANIRVGCVAHASVTTSGFLCRYRTRICVPKALAVVKRPKEDLARKKKRTNKMLVRASRQDLPPPAAVWQVRALAGVCPCQFRASLARTSPPASVGPPRQNSSQYIGMISTTLVFGRSRYRREKSGVRLVVFALAA